MRMCVIFVDGFRLNENIAVLLEIANEMVLVQEMRESFKHIFVSFQNWLISRSQPKGPRDIKRKVVQT